jgi:hypothetical protein
MNVWTIWKEFIEKLCHDSLKECDLNDEMSPFLFSFLCGKDAQNRREIFINAPVNMIDGEFRKSIFLSCPDDEYRFDFEVNKEKWKLCYIECITLPLSNINNFPYDSFIPLSGKENWIKAEKSISKMIYFFCKLRKIFNFDEALLWLNDGAGEFLCARSWVPFYKDSKSFILYSSWIENRINGENVSVEIFSDEKCVMRFKQHLWFKIYHATGHFRTQLSFDDYKKIFESIWQDRAFHSGWNIMFEYEGYDTILTFMARENKILT